MYKNYTNNRCMPPGYIKKFLLVMKITTFLLFIGFMQVSAAGLAQKLTLVQKDVSLKQVFKEINKQTGYNIYWSDSQLNGETKINANFKDTPLLDVMDKCLENTQLTYVVENKTVVVKEKEPSLLESLKHKTAQLFNLSSDITGTVTDTTGARLPGASVILKGTNFKTITDNNGNFSFSNVPQGKYTLSISYVGYEKFERTVEVNGAPITLKFTLHNSSSALDAVQIIAYGETTQRYTVGSISAVSAKAIEEQPVASPLQALEGRVPGLVVTQSSGVPGASLQIQIRGQNSISPTSVGNNVLFDNPLFIIDGVPFSPQNGNINQYQSLGTGINPTVLGNVGMSPFNSINPADIESIELLRDADATAIYGSRGANGVVLITTKRGKAGKTTVNGTIWSGDSWASNVMPMMNTQQYVAMRFQALKNSNKTPTISNAYDILAYDTTRNNNWAKYFLEGTAHTTDANVSVSGGTSNTQFRIGSGYHDETYIYPGDFADRRGSFDASLHHTSTDKKLSIDLTTNYSYDQNNSAAVSSSSLFTLPPDYPSLLTPQGTLNWKYNGINLSGNPLASLRMPYLLQDYNLIANLQLAYQLFSGFTIKSSFGYNRFDNNEYAGFPAGSTDPIYNESPSAEFGSNNFTTWIIEPQAEYKRNISNGKLDILVGGTYQKNTNATTSITGNDYPDDLLLHSISGAATTTATGSSSLYKYNGIFGRINYIWNSSYIIDVTGRRDGSSRFGPGKQFGNFGSVGGGWIFSNEPFFKTEVPFLSFGKLRVTYGTTGNDNISNYQYLSAYAPIGGESYQGSVGYWPQNLYNPDFSWAVTRKFEAGLDFGLMKDGIVGSVTWFRNRSSNQLVGYVLPEQTGFPTVTQNAPYTVQNEGWEIQVTSKNIKTKSFSWNTTFNITLPKNTLLSFPNLSTSPYANELVVGQSLSVIQGFQYAGVNPQTGLFQFQTAKGLTSSPQNYTDYKIIGNLDPKFYGGLDNTFAYGGFHLTVFLQFVKQIAPNYLKTIYGGPPGVLNTNEPAALLSRWQQPGDISQFQEFSLYPGNGGKAASDFTRSTGAYSDASFIRVKNIALSYNIPANFLKKIDVSGCSVFLNAQNLFTITDYKGDDPENHNFYALPPLKTLTVGLQFTF